MTLLHEGIKGVASLRDIIERKDKEIEQLQQIKGSRSRQKSNSSRHSSSSPGGIPELGVRIQKEMKLTKRRRFANNKVVSHHENCSKHSESGSQQQTDDKRHQRDNLEQTKFNRGAADHISTDRVVFSFGDADSDERPSATSDGVLSVATETDASICNHGDAFPEQVKSSETPQEKESRNPSKVPKPSSQKAGQVSATQTISRDITKPPSARKRTSRVTTVKDS